MPDYRCAFAEDLWFGRDASTLDDAVLSIFTEVTESLSVRGQLRSAEGMPVWAELHMSVSIGNAHSEVLAMVQDRTDEAWNAGDSRDFDI